MFEQKLRVALSEMASLAGWHPTRKRAWMLYFKDKGNQLDIGYGTTAREAIAAYVARNQELVAAEAAGLGLTQQEFVSGLIAEPEKLTAGEQPRSFSEPDIRSINSPATAAAITSWLNTNPASYKWIVKFGDDADTTPTPDAITYIKFGNAGGDTLTPHMILHTAGHAVCAAIPELTDDISDTINTGMARLLPHTDAGRKLVGFCMLLHMKAAAHTINGGKRGFPDIAELINELVGIYIKNGHIKIAPNHQCDYQPDPKVLATMGADIEDACHKALDLLVGGVIYDD